MANRIKGITVEIGGDTTKLQTALKGVNGEIKNTQSQLKDVEKLLKLDPGNTELLSQKQKLLSQAVGETKEKLETLKTAAEQANTALAKGEISQEQYDALQREIAETEQSLKKLESQANQSATAVQKVAAAGEKLKTAGDNISNAGQKMLPVTAAVTGLGTAAVTTAANFESSMSQVQATMGITKDSMSEVDGQSVNTMQTLNELAKKMGSETAFSASECADALNYLALAGYDTQEMCDTLPTVLNLAAAGGIDLASASDMVTDAMSALGMGVNEAGTMVDQMAKTASSTNTSVAQLGEGILTIGATAKSIKGGTAELNTALGILANNGVKGAEGGTHLRNIILSLQNPTDKAAASMEALGVDVYDAQGNMRSLNDILGDLNSGISGMTEADKSNIISKIFNKTDLASVNALLANTGSTWDDLQQSIVSSGGAAQQMADTQLDNLQGQLTILKSALEGLAISFGELLMPAIKSIVEHIQGFVDKLNGMDEGVKKTIVTIALVAAAVGPVLIVIGKVLSAVGTIMTIVPKIVGAMNAVKAGMAALNVVMAANPIILIVMAVIAAIAALVLLYTKCEWFRNAVNAVWQAISDFFVMVWNGIITFFTQTIPAAWNSLVSFFQGIPEWWSGIWQSVSDFFSSIWIGIQTTASTIWSSIKQAIEGFVQGLVTGVTGFITGLASVLTGIWTGIKNTATTIWTTVKAAVVNIVTGLKTAAVTAFQNLVSGIRTVLGGLGSVVANGFQSAISFITSLPGKALRWGADFINGIARGIRSAIGNVTSAVSDVASRIRSFLHFSVPDEGPLTDYESWMPDFVQGLAKGIEKSRGMVEKAVGNLSSDMVISPQLGNSLGGLRLDSITNTNNGTNGVAESVNLTQPVMIDGKVIATIVSEIQWSQGKVTMRNLGKA